MSKEYLIKSECYGNYSRGFISVEVVNQETYERLQKLVVGEFSYTEYGKEGKHSESTMTIDDNDFVIVSEDVNDIIAFKRLFGNNLGNLNYSDYVLEKACERGFFDDDEE